MAGADRPPGVDTPAQSEARSVAAGAAVDAASLTTEGQRRINLIWERTQAVIAMSVVETTLIVAALITILPLARDNVDQSSATAAVTGMVLLANLAGIVIGFYFGRTNHTRIGGVGAEGGGR